MNDASLEQREIETLVSWANAGASAGDASDAPAPVDFPRQGWLIQPDVTLDLPPYMLPVTGVIEWEAIAVPSPFKQDTWVTSIEIMQSPASCITCASPSCRIRRISFTTSSNRISSGCG